MMIERLIYPEITPVDHSFFNPMFFITKNSMVYDVGLSTYTVSAIDWKGFVEARRICQHNVFYESIPINPETGDPELPDDFNKIKYNNVNVETMLIDLYSRNIGYKNSGADGFPVVRNKGKDPSYLGIDTTREIPAYAYMQCNSSGTIGYTTLLVKQSLLDIKKDLFNFTRSEDPGYIYNVELKIENGLLYVEYRISRTLTVDNYFNKDIPISASYDYDTEEYFNYIVVESSGDNFDYMPVKTYATGDLTSFEMQEEMDNDDGFLEQLQTKGKSLSVEFAEKIISMFEMHFADREYLKDIKVCDIIELNNFSIEFNGRYQILKLSEIIENGYISYAIDEMEQI
ncbi:MAG: hypothetical protein EHM25_02755 [Nitrosopumilales archaeon]|nr:MAG: hypothetical protein EHM25_12425 [Nitrosopumilales archaeon]RPJ31574.1 MAG: hypothetical protein EHM25_02755 [Nitrosopumilales archaeon]